jgi:hypothetical protein
VGDVVLGKIKGYPPWPGIVSKRQYYKGKKAIASMTNVLSDFDS